jgi:hypothetical protein
MALPKTFVISHPTLVAIEQWFCFLLGIVCMASGVWGICMSDSEDLLGSAFVPALWVTAAACLGVGGELVCLGFAKTLPKSESPNPKLTNEPRKPEARRGTRETLSDHVTLQPEFQKDIHQTGHYR